MEKRDGVKAISNVILQSFLYSFRTVKMEKPRCHEYVSKASCVYSVSFHINMENHQLAPFMSLFYVHKS